MIEEGPAQIDATGPFQFLAPSLILPEGAFQIRRLKERESAEMTEASIRVGLGHDRHRLVPNRPLILGGIPIEFEMGLDGHSDADVLLHALTDALLGMLG